MFSSHTTILTLSQSSPSTSTERDVEPIPPKIGFFMQRSSPCKRGKVDRNVKAPLPGGIRFPLFENPMIVPVAVMLTIKPSFSARPPWAAMMTTFSPVLNAIENAKPERGSLSQIFFLQTRNTTCTVIMWDLTQYLARAPCLS